MRILFLANLHHITNTPCRVVATQRPKTGHHWMCAVEAPNRTGEVIFFDIRTHTFQDVYKQFPGGNPDLAIVWEPGWQALPEGLDRAPFPVVGCISDWQILMPRMAGILPAFDFMFTDRVGVRALNRMGCENVEYWPMWGHDPNHSKVIPEVDKIWDVVAAVNLNPDMWRERSRWLARLAMLGDRHRVLLAGGVYGSDYTRLLNAAKIVFNHAVRGEFNMRCYEAAACGSLLFCEEENEEVRDFFQDGVHCILYNESNLEDLISYYVSHDAERMRIVEAARDRVAGLDFSENLDRLVSRIDRLNLEDKVRHRLAGPPIAKRHYARQAAGIGHPGCANTALVWMGEAVLGEPESASVLHDFGAICLQLTGRYRAAEYSSEADPVWLRLLQRAAQLRPRCALYQMSLALGQLYLQNTDAATAVLQSTLELVQRQDDEIGDPLCLVAPLQFDEFHVQLAAWFNGSHAKPESKDETWRALITHRCAQLLGDLAERRRDLNSAIHYYSEAVKARPDLGSGGIALARVLLTAGRPVEAVSLLDRALTTDPMRLDAWVLYAEALRHTGRIPEAREFVGRRLAMLDRVIAPDDYAEPAARCRAHLGAIRLALREADSGVTGAR